MEEIVTKNQPDIDSEISHNLGELKVFDKQEYIDDEILRTVTEILILKKTNE